MSKPKKIYYKRERENGDKVSSDYISRAGVKYHVIVNFKLGYCKLLNSQRRSVLRIIHSKNQKVLLRNAKKFLKSFGVEFEYFERTDKIEAAKELYKTSLDSVRKKKYNKPKPEESGE